MPAQPRLPAAATASRVVPSDPPGWIARWVHMTTTFAASQPPSVMPSRIEVCPPERWPSSLTWSGRLQRWRQRGERAADAAQGEGDGRRRSDHETLAAVRDEFLECMQDLPGDTAWTLADRVRRARTMRELWYLRSPLYGIVATQHDQAEAERRIERLNRHFPLRGNRRGATVANA